MDRTLLLDMVRPDNHRWDVIVVGGGATGLGVAVDAASRGFSVALFEQNDFAKVTSSRSTKLVHGGVRYLQKGDVPLVREALHERGRLYHNAPHLVKDQKFLISNYTLWDNVLYTCGLILYDILSWGGLGLGPSYFISRKNVMKHLPKIKREGLKGGVVYHDGQFDDSRLAINLAQTCVELGGCPINHAAVTEILHNKKGYVSGVRVRDGFTGEEFNVRSRCVINAAGVFVDDIMKLDEPGHERMVMPSQGTHIVLDMKFLQSDYAIMVPKTSDGRVLFAVPWHNKVVVGTTDIPMSKHEIEPVPLEEEIDFILGAAALYMDPAPTRSDIRSVFAGQRPLAAPKKEGSGSTKELSRSHKIIVSAHNMITITGGKWTTYRRMAEDGIDKAIETGLLDRRKCVTRDMPIHGHRKNPDLSNHLYIYGSDIDNLNALMRESPAMREKIHPDYDYTVAEVVWSVREEMAYTVEDVLARRVRLLFIDAKAAIEAAPGVARIIAGELGKDESWVECQISEFIALARHYTVQ